jgi:FkbM family methyltransferase
MEHTIVRRIKAVRDRVMALPGTTRAFRALTSRGLIPKVVWLRLQPIGVVTVRPRVGGEFRYRATATDELAKNVVWADLVHYEPTTLPVFADLARRARVLVDGGAYSGVFTLLGAALNPGLRVVAFEPNPHAVAMLRAHLALNQLEDRVQVVEEALSDQAGPADLFVGDMEVAAGLTGEGARVPINMTPADVHLAGLDVDLVKLDVEGAEAAALVGMAETLKRCQPALIVECLTAEALAAVRHVTDPLGYCDCQWLGPVGPVPIQLASDYPRPFYPNFLLRTAQRQPAGQAARAAGTRP